MMAEKETYYLVDFENVHEAGLANVEKLGIHDHVHIFSTVNAPKISLGLLTIFNSAHLCSHIVSAGKQSLDMHLVAYLGYLLGTTVCAKSRYVIISNDADYDNIIKFLREQTAADIVRRISFAAKSSIISSPKPSAKPTPKPTPKSAPKSAPVQAKKVASQEKVSLNNEVQKILSKANCNKDVVGHVASLCVQYYNTHNAKLNVYRNLVSKYGQAQGLKIYNLVKKKI